MAIRRIETNGIDFFKLDLEQAVNCISNCDFDSAIKLLEKMAKEYPTRKPVIFYNLGITYGKMQKYPKAMEYLKKSANLGDNSAIKSLEILEKILNKT